MKYAKFVLLLIFVLSPCFSEEFDFWGVWNIGEKHSAIVGYTFLMPISTCCRLSFSQGINRPHSISYDDTNYWIKEKINNEENNNVLSFYIEFDLGRMSTLRERELAWAKLDVHIIDNNHIWIEIDGNNEQYPLSPDLPRLPQLGRDTILWRAERYYRGPNIAEQFLATHETTWLRTTNRQWVHIIPPEYHWPFARVGYHNLPDVPLYFRYYTSGAEFSTSYADVLMVITDEPFSPDTLIPDDGSIAFMLPSMFDGFSVSYYIFEHNNRKYLSAMHLAEGGSSLSPYTVALFDISDNNNVRTVIYETSTFYRFSRSEFMGTVIEMGLYAEKLCVVITEWDAIRSAYVSRLYSIEEDGLSELVDATGHNFQVIWEWDKDTLEITILEQHIPENP